MLQKPISVTQAATIKTAPVTGQGDHDSDVAAQPILSCKGTGDLMLQMTRVSDNSCSQKLTVWMKMQVPLLSTPPPHLPLLARD